MYIYDISPCIYEIFLGLVKIFVYYLGIRSDSKHFPVYLYPFITYQNDQYPRPELLPLNNPTSFILRPLRINY